MMDKILIYNADSGVEEYIDREIPIIKPIWHIDRPIQLLITYEQNARLMQSDYGMDMLNYFKSINPPTVNETEGIYIYLNELYDAHKMLLESFEIIINQRP